MKPLVRWWGVHFVGAELGVAVVLSVTFVVWAEFLGGRGTIDELLGDGHGLLYSTLASILGSLLGFAITATSIALGFSSSPRLAMVRQSEHYPTLWRVFSATIRGLGLATLLSLAGLVLDDEQGPNYLVRYCAFFGLVLSCLRICRAVWALQNVIAIVTDVPSARGGREQV